MSKSFNLNGKVYAVWKYSEAEKHILYNNKNSFFIEEHIYPGLFQKITNPNNNAIFANRNQLTKVAPREKILFNHGLSSEHIVKKVLNQIK